MNAIVHAVRSQLVLGQQVLARVTEAIPLTVEFLEAKSLKKQLIKVSDTPKPSCFREQALSAAFSPILNFLHPKKLIPDIDKYFAHAGWH